MFVHSIGNKNYVYLLTAEVFEPNVIGVTL